MKKYFSLAALPIVFLHSVAPYTIYRNMVRLNANKVNKAAQNAAGLVIHRTTLSNLQMAAKAAIVNNQDKRSFDGGEWAQAMEKGYLFYNFNPS